MKTKLSSATFAFATFAALVFTATPRSLRAATITVTNTADSGAGTLRAALASANNGDAINFALTYPAKCFIHEGKYAEAAEIAGWKSGPTLRNISSHC